MLVRLLRGIAPRVAVTLVLGGAGAAAASEPDLAVLLRPDPALPTLERVEAIAARLGAPGHPGGVPREQLFGYTALTVDEMARRPLDQVVERWLFLYLHALAHQWGRTQILLDYLRRYQALVDAGSDPLDRNSAAYAVLRGLRSAAYGVDDAAPEKYQRLALVVRPGDQVSQLFSGLFAAVGNAGLTREAIEGARGELLGRADVLRARYAALREHTDPRKLARFPEAVRILEAKASD